MNYHVRALRHLRRSLTKDVANTLACSIVGSRIDYCNALLYGATDKVLGKLQCIQNCLARVVSNTGIRQLHAAGLNSMDLLRDLHWLPIHSRIDYKVAVLSFNGLRHGSPQYLSPLLREYAPGRSLRSATRDLLVEVPSRIKLTSRRFACAAPHVWNELPSTVRAATSIASFKSQLKTHYFRLNFQ